MSKVFYSYYNLVRKPNTAFDCLKGIAVFARSGIFNVQINGNFATPRYNVNYYFMPIADVYQGALIRGDILHNTSTGGFYPLTDLTERPGRYRVRVLSPPATGGVSGRTLTIIDNTRSRFSFDSSACVVSLDATFPVSDFATQLQSAFATDFPGQSLGLPDLDPSSSIGEVLTMQGDPSLSWQYLTYPQDTITGDPITAPLQTIDFDTGQ